MEKTLLDKRWNMGPPNTDNSAEVLCSQPKKPPLLRKGLYYSLTGKSGTDAEKIEAAAPLPVHRVEVRVKKQLIISVYGNGPSERVLKKLIADASREPYYDHNLLTTGKSFT